MDEPSTTQWRFLFGFYPPEEAVGIAKNQGVPVSQADEAALRLKVEKAVAVVRASGGKRSAEPRIVDAPAADREHLAKLESEPTFSEMTNGMKSWSWKVVEIAALRSFQPSVNWDYVQKLKGVAPAKSDRQSVLNFCLPLAGSRPPERVAVSFSPSSNTYSLVTEHLDFRVLGQVQGEDPNTKRKFFGFVTGFGLPTITVAHYRDMYLLKNGYHRTVALLAAGHTEIPALVVETDSFQMTGATGPGFFSVDLLESARPPQLSDFLAGAAVDISRSKLRTVVTIHGEGQALPI